MVNMVAELAIARSRNFSVHPYDLLLAASFQTNSPRRVKRALTFLSLPFGFVLLFLCPERSNWGYWFANGIILYGFIVALYGSLSFYRLFKKARKISKTGPQQNDIQSI